MVSTLTATVPRALAGERLDRALGQMFEHYSRARLQRWIRDGCVRVDGHPTRTAKLRVCGGESVRIDAVLEDDSRHDAQAIELEVVFEDDALIVIDKPAGLVVHPGAGHRDGTLLNGLLHHAPALAVVPRAGLVHRIDKDTSGLLVVAKTVIAQAALAERIAAHRVGRRYLALAHGHPAPEGEVDAPIGRHPRHRTRMAVRPGARRALTRYRRVESYRAHSLLALELETGRTHQIRVHLAHLGHPIVGDREYAGARAAPSSVTRELAEALQRFPRQALHAAELSFEHPVSGETMRFDSALPQDMAALVRMLEIDRDRAPAH